MSIDPIMFFFVIVSVIILTLSLVAVTTAYVKLHKNLLKEQEEKEKIRREMHQTADMILDNAHTEAINILKKSHQEASTLTKDSKENLEEITQKREKELQMLSRELLLSYKTIAKKLREDNINILSNISKDIEKETVNEVHDYRNILQQETLTAQKIVGQKIEQTMEETEQEIREYKKNRLASIDTKIAELSNTLAVEILGESINQKKHEELILKALEKAKQEKIFI